MKVLHVIPSISPRRGGPSFAIRTMAKFQAEAGLDVEIVTTDDDGDSRLPAMPSGAVRDEDGFRIRYFQRQLRFYTVSWPLARWLARNVSSFDVLHAHALFSFPSVPATHYARRHGVPYVVRPLGTLGRWGLANRRPVLKRLSLAAIERRILVRAAAVHYTTEAEREEAALLSCGERAVVIPLGVDIDTRAAAPSPELFLVRHPELRGRRILLYLSRLDAKKGLDLLLPAFAALSTRHADVVLVIAGEGPTAFTCQLKKLAWSLGIAGDVVWAGTLLGEDKRAALAAASAFILPSRSENFGLAAVEAMAAGLPVVLCDGVAISGEALERGAAIVVPCDTAALTGALGEVFDHRAVMSQLGQRGRDLVAERFSARLMSAQLISLYESLVR